MKKIVFAAMAALSIGTATAQVKEGTVVYERKINMYKRIADEQMRAYMPEFRTSKHMLLFSDSTSIYKAVPEDEMPEPSEGGAAGAPRVMFKMGGGDADELYKNFAISKSITQTELGAKTYIIEDSIRQQQWKLTDETKKIAGYNCRKAVTKQKQRLGVMKTTITDGHSKTTDSSRSGAGVQMTEVEVVAWYAEDLLSPVGPENNGGLPGVILQLDINKGETVFTALEVKNAVNKKELKEPSKGKKVTREAFTKMQMEMMGNMQGSGGRTIRFGN